MLLVFLVVSFAVADDLLVTTRMGAVRGTAGPFPGNSVRAFKGIPYAMPPVKELRFLPPVPFATPWHGERDGSDFGDDCPQDGGGMSDRNQSEDCLFVNVWTPRDASPDDKLPVLVFLYGGSWQYGSDSFPVYNGEAFIHHHKKRVAVVTLNYRLGPLGFLGSSQLQSLTDDGSTGNAGLQDQRMALQWVQDNIRAFGGDPGTVMLFGESAGAGSTTAHLLAPRSKGLFHRAAMESGPVAHWTAKALPLVQTQYDRVVKAANCTHSSPREELTCLQAASVELLLKVRVSVPGYVVDWSPCIDMVELTAPARVLAERGQFSSNVPLLFGTNLNEGSEFVSGITGGHNATDAAYADWILRQYANNQTLASAIHALYPSSSFASPWWAASRVFTDSLMVCPARRTARYYRSAFPSTPIHLYHFTHEWDVLRLDPKAYLGVCHGSELVAVWAVRTYPLHGVPVPLPLTPAEVSLQHKFGDYWTNFAATGDPNSPSNSSNGLIFWPNYELDTEINIQLDTTLRTNAHLNAAKCDFWDDNWPLYP